MQTSWLAIFIMVLVAAGIVVWTTVVNRRERKRLEKKLNEEARMPAPSEDEQL